MSEVHLKTIELSNGEVLGYRERAGGEVPLLLIHGNMTSSKHWDVFIEALPDCYKVYAPDLRGFGLSSYHSRIETLKDFSDDIKLFVDEIGLENCALMGWSLGGGVALQFSADHPTHVDQLVLLASASTRGYPFYSVNENGEPTKRLKTIEEVVRDPMKTIPVQTAYDTKNKDLLRQIWNAAIYTNKQPDPEHYGEYLDDMTTQRNLADVYQALNIFNISEEDNGLGKGSGEAEKIRVPALVLWGKNDLVVTESMTKQLLEDLKGETTYVCLKNCGHSPLIDDLDQLVYQVDSFLQKQ